MTWLRMFPPGVKEQIDFSLHDFGLKPYIDMRKLQEYRLNFESGLVLSVIIHCVEQRTLFIFPHSAALKITVADVPKSFLPRKQILVRHLALPRSAYDLEFSMSFTSMFASMTRAVADTLYAGQCLTLK